MASPRTSRSAGIPLSRKTRTSSNVPTGVPLLARPIAQVDGLPAGSSRRADFGDWSEIWTVGDKLASPAIQFSVNAPGLPGGQGHSLISGPNIVLSCETAEGRRTVD